MESFNSLLQQQIAYYQARASEYDEWFLRQGRYDRGPELNSQWFQEVEQVRQALDQFKPTGRILELACGTGLWTQQILGHARQITAVDAVPEVLKLNQQRLKSSKVEYVQADIFTWRPIELFDVVFFSFWLSHVPPAHFESFWQMVAGSVKPGGRVFFIDSRYEPTSTAKDQRLGDPQANTSVRLLNDGREFRIIKIFYARDQLLKQLSQLGWQTRVYETDHYFLYGEGTYEGAQ
jgi:demethylmenaquinone methyltransferase/2-methoxy-6-polyprenyl-1,4-benzoquinol methylase